MKYKKQILDREQSRYHEQLEVFRKYMQGTEERREEEILTKHPEIVLVKYLISPNNRFTIQKITDSRLMLPIYIAKGDVAITDIM